MLPKKWRIERVEFSHLISRGKRYNSPNLSLILAPLSLKDPNGKSKFSFSVSKKTSALATDRNKLRRQGYSVISKYINVIKPGFFCSFSFKKGAKSLSFFTLDQEIKGLLSLSGVLS